MKKLIIAALLIVGLTVSAQDKKEMEKKSNRAEMEKMSPEARSEKRLQKMTKDLDLNEKQQKQMGQLISEQNANRRERNPNTEKPTPEERAAHKKQMQEMNEKMKTILTPEQYEKWRANIANSKGKGHGEMKAKKAIKTDE